MAPDQLVVDAVAVICGLICCQAAALSDFVRSTK
jgi:hypothetical protein